MRLEHHLVGGYVRYISPHIIIIIINSISTQEADTGSQKRGGATGQTMGYIAKNVWYINLKYKAMIQKRERSLFHDLDPLM